MNRYDSLATLEQRARRGDVPAKAELQRRLRPAMFQIVRRFLNKGIAPPGYARPIESECHRFAPWVADPRDWRPSWIGEIADKLCARLTDRLQSGSVVEQSTRDTVVMNCQ